MKLQNSDFIGYTPTTLSHIHFLQKPNQTERSDDVPKDEQQSEHMMKQLRQLTLYNKNSNLMNHMISQSPISEELEGTPEQIKHFLQKQQAYDPKLVESRQHRFRMMKTQADRHYIGEVFNGKCHGVGIVLFLDGRLYEGQLENNIRQGQGLFVGRDRSWYYGQYSNDKKDGMGIEVTSKYSYQGSYVNGLRHGLGTMIWQMSCYTGEWRLGQMHGFGMLQTDQSKFEGNFQNFTKHGKGRQFFKNGDVYQGPYVNGFPQGEGEYRWKLQKCIFKGTFEKGQRTGKGSWQNERGDRYVGHYLNDLKDGYGQFYWKSGNFYKGNFKEDVREGYGEMYWNDGAVYKGQWSKGVQHGRGDFYKPGVENISGIFQKNVLVEITKGQLKTLSHSAISLSERRKNYHKPIKPDNRVSSMNQIHKKSTFIKQSKSKSKSNPKIFSKSPKNNERSHQDYQHHIDHSPNSHHRFCKACAVKQFISMIDIVDKDPTIKKKSKSFQLRKGRKPSGSEALKRYMKNQAAQYLKFKF